jgi:hypothetical protein
MLSPEFIDPFDTNACPILGFVGKCAEFERQSVTFSATFNKNCGRPNDRSVNKNNESDFFSKIEI